MQEVLNSFCLYCMMLFNSTLGSLLPNGANSFMILFLNVTSEVRFMLPISLFSAGYIVAPVFVMAGS